MRQNSQIDDEKLASCAESLLAFGISFAFSVLENPNIWQSDFEPIGEAESKKVDQMSVEKYVEEVVFSKDKTHMIFLALTRKYLVYTEEEIEAWKADSLKFYLEAKNESNEKKGNYLREKALRLFAGTELRLSTQFEDFCTFVSGELAKQGPGSSLPLEM